MTDLRTPPAAAAEQQVVVEPGRRWVRVVLAVICLGIAGMWVYAFFFAPDQGVYRVSDDAWRSEARSICERAQDVRLGLADTDEGYIAHPTVEQMRQRADIVDRATDIIEGMLDDVVALPLTSARDREIVDIWQGHYRTLIADRRTYTSRLRSGELVPYRETMVGGGPVTNVLTDFTSGNDVKDCAPPGELGGDG